jgi:outer membrane lipoprotein-sorting protein
VDGRDLVFLLHSGGRELQTVRLTATTRTDHEAVAKAVERWNRRVQGSTARVYAHGPAIERPRFDEETTRLWIERPDRVREETEGRFSRYAVSVGETWWMFNEHQGAVTNNGAPNHSAAIGQQFDLMLEPAQLLPHFDFQLAGEEEHAGRSVVRVHARERRAGDQRRFLPPLPVGCAEAELLVDLETGTLLRLTALFDGAPGVDLQITEIAFDEPIPPATFVFVPPPREAIEDVTEQRALRDEPIEDVARRASFTVFLATGLDGCWRLRAMHLPARRGQPHEHVHLHYHRDDAAHSFGINQQSADVSLMCTGVSEPEQIEHDGEQLHVIRPTDSFPLGSVRLVRDGTSIEITADNLALERLLEIVDGLRPAPRDDAI